MCIKCRNINENAYDSTIGMCIVAIEHVVVLHLYILYT